MKIFDRARLEAVHPGRPFDPLPDHYVVVIEAEKFHALPTAVKAWLRNYSERNYTNGNHCWIEISMYEMRALLRTLEENGVVI